MSKKKAPQVVQPNTPVPITDPYRVKAVLMQVEIEFFDPKTGKTKNRALSNQLPLYEVDFFPGLLEFLKSKGIVGQTPKEDKKHA